MKIFEAIMLLLAGAAIAYGVVLLCNRNGGGGGGSPTVTPSTRFPGGGFSPGFVSTQVVNRGLGASTPRVEFN